MKAYKPTIKDRIAAIDPTLFFCSTILSLMGIITLIGGRDAFTSRVIIMQIAMIIAGNVVMFVLANLDYRMLVDKLSIPMFLGSLAILALTVIYGESAGENTSWINVPIVNISIQPSEFVKATFIMTFAKHLDSVKEEINKPKNILALAIHAGAIVGLVFISGDLGVTLVFVGIVAVMLFCAGLKKRFFLAALGALLMAFPFIWPFMPKYQQMRILVGFNPDMDPSGYGSQAIKSRSAIANGGFFGRGFSGGHVYSNMYAAETDFIFATWCEKFGFVGGIIMILVLALLVVRLMKIAEYAREDYGSLICLGIAGMIVIQSIENIGMCLCMMPVIGITLPFVSAGGSSMLAIYAIIGIANSVYAGNRRNDI